MLGLTRRMGLIGLIAALIALATAPSAHAVIGVGARASYVSHQHIKDNSLMVGLMGRLRFGMIGFEAAVERRSHDLDEGPEVKIYPITASVLIHPVPVIYGIAGLGLYRSTLSGATFSDQSDNSIGFHYGAGLEWPFLPLVKLVGDLRYQFVDYEYGDIPAEVGKVDADAIVVSAGVMVSL